jgi:acetoin:2,6-dichlorophenolindophenol oxidoreductase subunit alpha
VDPAEIEHWATTNDPLDRYVAALTGNGWATPDELSRIDREIDAELDAAVSLAEQSPMPEAEEAMTDVYADGPVNAPWTRHSPPDPTRA